MKKTLIFLATLLFAQDLYFSAFKDIQKAKKLMNTDPQKAQALFIEARGYLKQALNKSIDKNQPSSQCLALLGRLYLNGWGGEKDIKKATQCLCAAAILGNFKAKRIIKKQHLDCPSKINFKELKQ